MLQGEKLYPVPKAVELATGHRPHPSTCQRWRFRGVNGVLLETQRQGGRRVTSVEAVHRFNAAVTSATDGPQAAGQTTRKREAEIARAERELAQAGI